MEVTQIIIGLNISSRSYFFEKENSVAYVSNEKTHMDYLFEGKSADIWTVIFNTRNYNTVYEYAKRNSLEEQLEQFLLELTENGLINDDSSAQNCTSSSSSCVPYEKAEFEKERNFWFKKNGLYIQLILELTYSCNLKCKHCYNDKKTEFMPFEKVKELVDSAYELGFYAINLTGGECTLHENFLEIVKYIREKGMNLFIYTNGQKLYDNDIFCKKFLELYPSSIKISLYSMKESVHDSITGVKGSHKKTLGIIKKLKDCGAPVNINFFMMHDNYGELDSVRSFAEKENVPFHADSRFSNNENRKNKSVAISTQEYSNLFNFSDNYFSSDLEVKNEINKKFLSSNVCNAGIDRFCISPTLDVYPCSGVNYKLGNINESSLLDIVNGSIFEDFKKNFIKKNLKDCYKQEHCKYCFYCPSLNYNSDNYLAPVELCCERANVLLDIHKKGDAYGK